MNLRETFSLARATISEWLDDNSLTLGAALSYYTVFSLAPLLIIAIAIAGLFFGQEAARGQIMGQMQGMVGKQGASAMQEMLAHASKPSSGVIATIVGVITLVLGASGVVGQLQTTLNTVFEVDPQQSGGILRMIRNRMLSIGMVMGIGFLLLVSLLISAALTAVSHYFGGEAFLWEILNFVAALGIATVLFAITFKYLPQIQIAWKPVWIGAILTAILFTIGKTVLGIYIGHSSVASSYGAAGSLVVVLVWVYYSSQILFLGAEFTQVYSNRLKERRASKTEEDTAMATSATGLQQQAGGPLEKAAFQAGYQKAKIESTAQDVKETAREKKEQLSKTATLVKWGFRIVDFLGLRRSVKLGWKGWILKKKIDKLSKDDEAA